MQVTFHCVSVRRSLATVRFLGAGVIRPFWQRALRNAWRLEGNEEKKLLEMFWMPVSNEQRRLELDE